VTVDGETATTGVIFTVTAFTEVDELPHGSVTKQVNEYVPAARLAVTVGVFE
jgi:hypothetical protein